MDFLQMANELRLIVLMENEEHTGFTQVLLNAEQFKKVSNDILTGTWKDESMKDGYEMTSMNRNDDKVIPIEHFEGMESIML